MARPGCDYVLLDLAASLQVSPKTDIMTVRL